MKIAKRVVTGLIGTITLTSLILYAINIHHTQQAASALKSSANAEDADTVSDDSCDDLSIDFSERQLVYQSQDASEGAEGTNGSEAPDGQNQAEQNKADAGIQTDAGRGDSSSPDSSTSASRQDSSLSGADHSGLQSGKDKDAAPDGQAPPDSEKDEGQTDDDDDSGTVTIKINLTESKPQKTGAKQSITAKTNIAKTDTDKADTKKTDAKKSDAKQSEKTADKKTDSAKTNSKQSGTAKTNSNKTNTSNAGKKDTADTRYTFQTVTEEYFSDALFIGDSRTVGMQQSSLLPGAVFYAKTGIGIGDILTERIVNENGYLISVKDALSRHSFGKVYIMIGINDMSMGDTQWFKEKYAEILNTVRRTQPDAIIYIQGNIPMSYGTQDLHGSLNNLNLRQRDEASKELADSKTIFYLDVNTLYADANGHLASMYTTDGLHIKPNYYPLWTDYLKHRAIVR